MNNYRLVFELDGRVINITFKDIKRLDEFTFYFDDDKSLFSSIQKMFDLKIKLSDLKRIYVIHQFKEKNSGMNKVVKMPVKYSGDDYVISSVKMMYAKFYKDDPGRIISDKAGIRNVKHAAIKEYVSHIRDITNDEIELAVSSFLNGGYKKVRDAYFTLKYAGYPVKIKKEIKTDEMVDRTDFGLFQSGDFVIDSLLRHGRESDEEHALAMDKLSRYDMDEIAHKLEGEKAALFDFQSPKSKKDKLQELNDELLMLQELTGLKYDELRDNIINRSRN